MQREISRILSGLKKSEKILLRQGRVFFKLKPEITSRIDAKVPAKCKADVRFVIESEISCIYKKTTK